MMLPEFGDNHADTNNSNFKFVHTLGAPMYQT